ncbi:MAG: type II toxin-antitoxin system VapC family toxin [Alkalispirochaeta sp.]
MILFDTDICIEILRGNAALIERRSSYDEEVAVSFMTVAELYYGAYKSSSARKNRSLVEEFLLTVNVIDSVKQIAKRFGELKARQNRRGMTVADADLLIAATAIERCSFLVTGNIRHFEMIEGLKIENWRAD